MPNMISLTKVWIWFCMINFNVIVHCDQTAQSPETAGAHNNDLEHGPRIVETLYHVTGPEGETSKYIARQQKILEEEEAVDLEKFSENNDEKDLHRREYVDHIHNHRFSLRSYIKRCIESMEQAKRNNKAPDDLPCVKTLLTEKRNSTLDKRGVIIKEEINGKDRHWPGGVVPYVMTGFNEDQIIDRLQAHHHIEYWSCVRFVNRTTEGNYVNHIDNGGCTASIGMIDNDKGQDVSCCGGEACVHEYFHALGLHHEHIHPEMLDFTRINYNTMDKQNWEGWTPLIGNPPNYYTGPYDLGTILHYKPWHSTISHHWSLTVLDPDQKYLLYDSDHLHFLSFKALSQMYKCGETHCGGITCNYGGYPTKVKDRCTCRCPEGRDPGTSCNFRYKGASHIPTLWPSAASAVLGSSNGHICPTGFQTSVITLHAPYVGNSDEFSVSIKEGDENVEMTFCTKEQTSAVAGEAEWAPGKYCIFRVGSSCPAGFKSGSMTFHSVSTPGKVGSPTPSYTVSGSGVKFQFCCRKDALHQDALELPKTHSFTLLQYNGDCQSVVDMVPFKQDVTIAVGSTWSKEGLVPDHHQYWEVVRLHLCYYAAVHIGGGKNTNLKSSAPSKAVVSPSYPNTYSAGIVNYYLIKSPENTTIKLRFEEFSLEHSADGTQCVDYMEIFQYLPGQEGVRYCGSKLEKTFISETNQLNMKFVNALTFNNSEIRKFKFSVDLVTDSDYCYTGKGENYRGTVDYTRHYEKCLPWAVVKDKCLKHPFDQRYFDAGLESNYCRNPGQGTRPWCYTAIDGCRRDYCDVCKLEKCYDIEAKCNELMQKNPEFCLSDPEAERVCRKSCDYCGSTEPVPKVTEHHCDQPPPFPDAKQLTVSGGYDVGDTVTFKCNSGEETKTRVCTVDGWTGGHYVCGQCPTGWVPRGDFCYKFYKENVELQEAIQRCEREGANLVSITDPDEQEFVMRLRGEPYYFWLGITPCVSYECNPATDGSVRSWLDGAPFQWSNFDPDWKNDYKQFFMTYSGTWASFWDDRWVLPYMCKKFLSSDPQSCQDNISSCKDLLTLSPTACVTNPEFKKFQCPRSCGFCKVDGDKNRCYQGQPRPENAERVIHNIAEGEKREKVGSYYQYKCFHGYELHHGDLYRACLNDGKLTGQAPVCKPSHEVLSCSNNLEMLPRGSINFLQGHMNVMDNAMMRAHKSGILHAITFYSEAESIVAFLVLRRKNDTLFTLVNAVDVTSGFKRIINADVSRYGINVQSGDYLGFFNPAKSNVFTYDQCKTDEDRVLHDGYMNTAFLYNSQVIIGNDYEFKRSGSSSSCRIHSIKMCIV